MSTHFLNANLTEKDGKVLPAKVFARDRKSDEVVWLNFSFADRNRLAALHGTITESKSNGSHWVINLDGLADAVGQDAIDVTDTGNTAIACSVAQVVEYAQCVQNATPDEVDEDFAAMLAAKSQPVELEDNDEPFAFE